MSKQPIENTRPRTGSILVGCTFALALLTSPLQAAPVVEPLEDEQYFADPGARLDNPELTKHRSELAEIVAQFEAGEVEAARYALAEILSQDPNHAVALELAALTLIQTQDYEAAEEALRRALQSEPRRPSLLAKLGLVLMLQGEPLEGRPYLSQALDFDPENRLALRYLGWIAEQQGNLARAQHLWGRLVEQLSPADGLSEAHVDLARVLNLRGAHADAQRLLQPFFEAGGELPSEAALAYFEALLALEELPRARDVLETMQAADAIGENALAVARAQLALREGDLTRAGQHASGLLDGEPMVAAAARHLLARIRVQEGDTEAAMDMLQEGAREAPVEATRRYADALMSLLREQGSPQRAVAVFRDLVSADDDAPVYALRLAQALQWNGQRAQAVASLREAVERHPQSGALHYYLGAFLARDAPEQARDAFRQAAEANPQRERYWRAYAGMEAQLEGVDAAIEVLQLGLAANPETTALLGDLANFVYDAGNLAEAEHVYRLLHQRQPDAPEHLTGLALTLLDRGNALDEAQRLIEEALARSGEVAPVKSTQAWYLYHDGDPHAALEILEGLEDRLADHGAYRYYVGKACLAVGDERRGQAELQRATELGLPAHYQRDAVALLE